MDLLADLRHYPAADAMQWAAAARFDGRLLFRRNRRSVSMSFANGRIIRCESSDPLESFRRHLFARGLVDELDLAASDRYADPQRLGETLIEMKVLSQAAVREAYTEFTLDLACSVVPWIDGVVAASAANLRPLHDPESEPLDPIYATMEAARRVDDLAVIAQTLPHDNVRLGTRLGATPAPGWTAGEKRLLEVFVDSQTISELYAAIGACRYHFMCDLSELIARGAILLLEIGEPPSPPSPNRLSLVDVLLDSDLDRRLRA